jgi:SAM-dependent methyltransferase
MGDSSRDPKERFSSRVDAYVAARPRYPQAVIDHLKREIGLTPDWRLVDLGSGTGISCELFLANGNPVTAVEPNAAMRSAAEQSLRAFASFTSIDGSAEATTLPDACADLVIAAQAFHWFNIPAARKETIRILRPGGYALLMWNDRLLAGTPFLEAYENLLVTFGTDYLKVRHNNIVDADLRAFFGPDGFQSAGFANEQRLDWNGLRARLESSSYVPHNDPQMIQSLRDIFEAHNDGGYVTMQYRTTLFYSRLAPARL